MVLKNSVLFFTKYYAVGKLALGMLLGTLWGSLYTGGDAVPSGKYVYRFQENMPLTSWLI